MKVLILSCSTGEGHNSAAKAIFEKLTNDGIACEVKDVLLFKSEKSARRTSSAYSGIICKAPALFGLAYFLGGIYDRVKLPSPIYAYHASYVSKLYSYIIDGKFTHVVCVHLYAMEAMTAVKKKYSVSLKTYGVLTDYTTIPFYKDTDLDAYFVPNDMVKEQLAKVGIERNKIFVTGIPVSIRFYSELSKPQARERLDLPQDKKIVAVMSGGAGCGKIKKLCNALLKNLDNDVLILAFVGRNETCEKKLNETFKCNERLRVVEFTSDIPIYLKACDVVLSKPGGLSSTEIAVANLPFVHLKAIPGCETANINYFNAYGLSLRGDTTRRAVMQTELLLSDEKIASAMQRLQAHFIQRESTQIICNKLMEDKQDASNSMVTVYHGRIFDGKHHVQQIYPQARRA